MSNQYIVLPNGNSVGLGAYAKAIREVKADPDRDYRGWSDFAVDGHRILHYFGKLVQDKINEHLAIPEDNRGPVIRLLKRNGGRKCGWCGEKFIPKNLNNAAEKCCSASCRQAYFF